MELLFLNEPDNVAKIKAWIPLVNSPRKIKGIGITKGTNETSSKCLKPFATNTN